MSAPKTSLEDPSAKRASEETSRPSVEDVNIPSDAAAGQPSSSAVTPILPSEYLRVYHALLRSAEHYSEGVTHRVTAADFSAIVTATTSTLGPWPPIRVRGNVPPSVASELARACKDLADARQPRMTEPKPKPKATTKSKPKAKASESRKGGKPKREPPPGKKPLKGKGLAPLPAGDQEELDPLAGPRSKILSKALRAFRTTDKDLAAFYARIGITPDSIAARVKSLSPQEIQSRSAELKGIPPLSFLGMTSMDVVSQHVAWDECPEAFAKLYACDLNAAAAAAGRVVQNFPGRPVSIPVEEGTFPCENRTAAADALAGILSAERPPDSPPVLIPALAEKQKQDLTINIGRHRAETNSYLIKISSGEEPTQRSYAQVVRGSQKGDGRPTTLLITGAGGLRAPKACVPLYTPPPPKRKGGGEGAGSKKDASKPAEVSAGTDVLPDVSTSGGSGTLPARQEAPSTRGTAPRGGRGGASAGRRVLRGGVWVTLTRGGSRSGKRNGLD